MNRLTLVCKHCRYRIPTMKNITFAVMRCGRRS
nr:MAG TPA: PriA DNA helicase Cys-rich region (CRR) domain [Caudoviricetes sp.]